METAGWVRLDSYQNKQKRNLVYNCTTTKR